MAKRAENAAEQAKRDWQAAKSRTRSDELSPLADRSTALGQRADGVQRRADEAARVDAVRSARGDAIEEINGFRIREGTNESGPNMDWNKWYLEKDGRRVAGPFNRKGDARKEAEKR